MSDTLNPDKRLPLIPIERPRARVSILAEVADYNHRIMNIPEMWKTTMGKGVKVVILDTGVPNHVDLDIAGGKSFIPFDYYEDKQGHSSHVAGIIAAIANNGMGVMGIAPDVVDYYGAVLDGDGVGSAGSIAKGIYWAVDVIGADIINMSLGMCYGVPHSPELEAACDYAASQGVAVFAAAGNEGGRVGQPACYDSVIAVGAVDSVLKRAPFSNYGPEIDFAVGGVDVFSTYLNNTYASQSGTSMACPALVGAASLILSDAMLGKDPRRLSPEELKEKLRKIAFDIGPKGVDMYTGNGIPVFGRGPEDPEAFIEVKKCSWWRRFKRWFRR